VVEYENLVSFFRPGPHPPGDNRRGRPGDVTGIPAVRFTQCIVAGLDPCRITGAQAGPIIGLALSLFNGSLIEPLDSLRRLNDAVIIPPTVANEPSLLSHDPVPHFTATGSSAMVTA